MIDPESVKFPKDEKPQIIYRDTAGAIRFIVTRKGGDGEFSLYEAQNDKLLRLGKSISPEKLEDKFDIVERLCLCE